MGETIELKMQGGPTIGAYKALPEGTPKGAIVVVQEIFGVNHHIRAVTDRFAAQGYAAIAPAIFDPAEPGVELPYDGEGMKRGMALAQAVTQDQYMAALDAAVAEMKPYGKVGIVGFCLGGTLAYGMAARDAGLAAAVCFYGGGIAQMAGAILKCPVQMHFGEKDDHIPAADIETIRKAHPDVPIYTYPAGHGFNCDERGSYDAPSAKQAMTRALAFLGEAIG